MSRVAYWRYLPDISTTQLKQLHTFRFNLSLICVNPAYYSAYLHYPNGDRNVVPPLPPRNWLSKLIKFLKSWKKCDCQASSPVLHLRVCQRDRPPIVKCGFHVFFFWRFLHRFGKSRECIRLLRCQNVRRRRRFCNGLNREEIFLN